MVTGWQPFSRRQAPADHAVGFQLGDLLVAEPDFGEQLMVVLTQQRRRMQMEPVGAGRKPHRHRTVWRGCVDRVADVLEEAAELQLRDLGLAMRLHHFGDRNTGIP